MDQSEGVERWFLIKTTDNWFTVCISSDKIITFISCDDLKWMLDKDIKEINFKQWLRERDAKIMELLKEPKTYYFPYLIEK